MSEESALDDFKSVTTKATDIKTLIGATQLSFQIIEPWAKAESENKAVQKIIGSLQDEARNFFVSVDHSYKNAQEGYSFAKSAAGLCDSLMGIHKEEEIKMYIREMQDTARKAYNDAKITAKKFREIRKGFHHVAMQIPEAREDIEVQQEAVKASKARAERRSLGWGNMVDTPLQMGNKKKGKSKGKGKGKNKAMDGGEVGHRGKTISIEDDTEQDEDSGSTLKMAGALISLPVTLPLVLVAGLGKMAFDSQVQDRERQLLWYDDAVKMLDDAMKRLEQLMEKMDVLASYWLAMDAVLENMHSKVERLRGNQLSQLRLSGLRRDWTRVGGEYLEYKQELIKLADCSPAFRAITTGAGPLAITEGPHTFPEESPTMAAVDWCQSTIGHDCIEPKSTSNSQVIGLQVILPSLTSNMGQAMGALYEIQMVTIKAGSQNSPGLSNQFKEIREALYQCWDLISQVLKKGYSFAGEVVRLQELSQTSNRVEMNLLLQELIITSKICQKESHKLVEQYKVIMQQYFPAKANFTTTLRNLTNSNEERRRSGSQPPIDEGAIGRFGKVFEDLWKDVENMDIFFDVQSTKCKRFLDAAQGRNKDVSMDESRQFANQWSGYQPMLLKTYVDVCRICDAVTVSPDITTVLAASTPNPEHRSGSWLRRGIVIVSHLASQVVMGIKVAKG